MQTISKARLFYLLFLFSPAVAWAVPPVACQPFGQPPAGVQACLNNEFHSCQMTINGAQRHFCIHVPAFPQQQAPVVFGFHGASGQASVAVNWLDKHTEQGMILVAPTALPSPVAGGSCERHWRQLSPGIDNWPAFAAADPCGGSNRDDLDFVRGLTEYVNQKFHAGPAYALGHSSGAGMVLQLKITEPFASDFAGFALNANGINSQKDAAVRAGAGAPPAPYGVNGGVNRVARPTLLIWGTGDKTSFPTEDVGRRVIELSNLVIPGDMTKPCRNPADWPTAYPTQAEVEEMLMNILGCFKNSPMHPGDSKHDLLPRYEETRRWLVAFNRADSRAVESLYPDLGHGGDEVTDQDETEAVRRDHRRLEGGAHVAAITVIDGQHLIPGTSGNHAPCTNHNCDIDAVEEILQFWRAHAGLRNLWR